MEKNFTKDRQMMASTTHSLCTGKGQCQQRLVMKSSDMGPADGCIPILHLLHALTPCVYRLHSLCVCVGVGWLVMSDGG